MKCRQQLGRVYINRLAPGSAGIGSEALDHHNPARTQGLGEAGDVPGICNRKGLIRDHNQIPLPCAEIECLIRHDLGVDAHACRFRVATCDRDPLVRDVKAGNVPTAEREEHRVSALSHANIQRSPGGPVRDRGNQQGVGLRTEARCLAAVDFVEHQLPPVGAGLHHSHDGRSAGNCLSPRCTGRREMRLELGDEIARVVARRNRRQPGEEPAPHGFVGRLATAEHRCKKKNAELAAVGKLRESNHVRGRE